MFTSRFTLPVRSGASAHKVPGSGSYSLAAAVVGLTVAVLLPAQSVFAQSAAGSTTELYSKLQQLEQEVMTLRGQLEEQQHLIRKLQKQRLSDYQDLDGRISAARSSSRPPSGAIGLGAYTGVESSATPPATSQTTSQTTSQIAPQPVVADQTAAQPVVNDAVTGQSASSANEERSVAANTAPAATSSTASNNSGSEKSAYDAAQALVKGQQFSEALQAFRGFTEAYPAGQYIANAHYWLGVLYTYEAETDNAIKEFNTVVQSYPTHRKAPDALFKLAKAHHLRGDETTAKILLNRVATDYANSGDRAVQLAKDYLETEFGG